MVIKMSESEYKQYVENQPEDTQAWMDYVDNGGSMDPSDTFDAGWEAGQARIKQLEKLNSQLAAEVDRQRAVVEAARNWFNGTANWSEALAGAVAAYEAAKREG